MPGGRVDLSLNKMTFIDEKEVSILRQVIEEGYDSIDLSDNLISDEGLLEILRLVQKADRPISLDLSKNIIGFKGALYLSFLLDTSNHNIDISLSGNAITDKGAELLSVSLSNARHNISLDLSLSMISDSGFFHIITAINNVDPDSARLEVKVTHGFAPEDGILRNYNIPARDYSEDEGIADISADENEEEEDDTDTSDYENYDSDDLDDSLGIEQREHEEKERGVFDSSEPSQIDFDSYIIYGKDVAIKDSEEFERNIQEIEDSVFALSKIDYAPEYNNIFDIHSQDFSTGVLDNIEGSCIFS